MVDDAVGRDLAGLLPEFKAPGVIEQLLSKTDGFTKLFKAGLLAHPARHARDFVSSQVRNLTDGLVDPRSYLASSRQADKLLFGNTAKGLEDIPAVKRWLDNRGLPKTSENASRAVRHMYAQYGPGGENLRTDRVGTDERPDRQNFPRGRAERPDRQNSPRGNSFDS